MIIISDRGYSGLYRRFNKWLNGRKVRDWRELEKQFERFQGHPLSDYRSANESVMSQRQALEVFAPAFGIANIGTVKGEKVEVNLFFGKSGKAYWRDKKGKFAKAPK